MELDTRCRKIIDLLINRDTYLSLQEIALYNDVSRRTVYYDLERINEFLHCANLEALQITRKKGIMLPIKERQALKKLITKKTQLIQFFSPSERVKIIVSLVLRRDHTLIMEDFMEACDVSRSTIVNDLKIVQKKMSEYNLELKYTIKKGYYITGNVIKKRAVFFLYFNELYKRYRNGEIPLGNEEVITDYLERLNKIEKELQYEFVDGVCYGLAVFFSTIEYRKDPLLFEEKDILQVIKTKEFSLVEKYFANFSSFEQVYLTLHLLGSRMQNIPVALDDNINEEAYELACDLTDEFERLATVEFENRKELEHALYFHLKNSLYRYRFGILIGNPLLDDIKREYGYLFSVTKKAVEYIEQQLSLPIHDSEVAYLTLHFGSALNSQSKKSQRKKKVIIMCPNGVSTANMLKIEIQNIIQNNLEIEIANHEDLANKNLDYDFVISTIDDNTIARHKLIIVNPILSDMDRLVIMKKILDQNIENSDAYKLLNIIKPYLKNNTEDLVRNELLKFFNYKELYTYQNETTINVNTFMQNPEFIKINKQVISWTDSINEAASLLENKQYINSLYAKNIIRQLKKYGPYMFIANGVMLAHSKISDGSLKVGLSLVIYPKGIKFERQKVAYLVFVMSAEDQYKHLKILSSLINLFEDTKRVKELVALEDIKAIQNYFKEKIN